MKEQVNYEEMMTIDPEALDVEWLQQAGRFVRLAEEQARIKHRLARLNEKLEVQEAVVAKEVRKNPAKHGMEERATEGGIKAAVLLDEEVQGLRSGILKRQYELDLVTAAVRAMEHRKAALEELVKLQGQQYFAGPKEPHDLKHDLKAAKKEQHEAVVAKIKSKVGK